VRNPDIFRDYDMVVAVTQETINLQLKQLVKLETIRSKFILYQSIDDEGNISYTVYENWDDVPKSEKDKNVPNAACVYGQSMLPQVHISAPGENITLVLNFQKGTAFFWVGQGPKAKLRQFDMAGWKYGISITLDLLEVKKEAIGKHIAVPELVEKQLSHFLDEMFRVSHLFLDFNSTNLVRFDPAQTSAPGAPDIGIQQFIEFMGFYLSKTVEAGNPYILGYTIQTTPQQPVARAQQVPESLRPVGTTFNLFRDSSNDKRSTLNFILATMGGHGQVNGKPGWFDENWIAPTDQCDGKLIYSHACMIEKLLIQPLYESFSQKCYDSIKVAISVPQGNTYAEGRKAVDGGLDLTISKVDSGDNQYVNTFHVRFASEDNQVKLSLNGDLLLFKSINKNVGVCEAHAWARGSVKWKGTITLTVGKDASGAPKLQTSSSFEVTETKDLSDQNACAKTFEWIGAALGKVLAGLSNLFGANMPSGVISQLFVMLMATPVPGLGDLRTALGNLPGSFNSMFMLPAGDVFLFKKPGCDAEGNLSMQLTYQADH
jgi:hypothetical protein